MKHVVTLAAAIEIPTGLLLVFAPSKFTRLLFAADMFGPGDALGPLAGFGLIGLAIACWPSRGSSAPAAAAVRALLVFSLLCAAFLAYQGSVLDETGPLLWPAAVGHGCLGLLLLWYYLAMQRQQSASQRWRATMRWGGP